MGGCNLGKHIGTVLEVVSLGEYGRASGIVPRYRLEGNEVAGYRCQFPLRWIEVFGDLIEWKRERGRHGWGVGETSWTS